MFEFLFKYSRTTFENGEFLFAREWPLWVLVLAALAAAVVIGYSLVRRRGALHPGRLFVLGLFQLALVAVMLALLWQPSLSTQTLRAQENSVAVVVDTSASMSYGEGDASRLQQAVAALDDGVVEELAETFEMRLYAFSTASEAIDALGQVPAPGASTRIGDALVDVLREARSSALGAVVLVSDGADNSGTFDAAQLAEIGGYGVPIHTVGVGREAIPEDIELESVSAPFQAMAGSRVSAQVSIRHADAGEAQLKVYDGDAILVSEAVALAGDAGVTTHWVDFDVGDAGVKDLRFALDAIPGERNTI
ncbi:MAG: VWA domain-containing protein, partial [Rhodospirillaceae bacterium]|nr:VWA domain-containing protein [Rhodospirillaceae bacterium]